MNAMATIAAKLGRLERCEAENKRLRDLLDEIESASWGSIGELHETISNMRSKMGRSE